MAEQNTDPEQQLERQTAEFRDRIEKLGEDVDETRQDWQRKRADDGVPGANPLEAPDPDEPPAGAPTGGPGKHDESDEVSH